MVFSGVKYRVTKEMGHYCCLAALNHAHMIEIMVLAEWIFKVLSSSCRKTLVNESDNRIKVVPSRKDLSCNNLNWIINPIGISFSVCSSTLISGKDSLISSAFLVLGPLSLFEPHQEADPVAAPEAVLTARFL